MSIRTLLRKQENMNQQEAASTLELDLKLNILDSSLPTESPSSSLCSKEAEGGEGEAKSMVVVGCPSCIMYIITSLESSNPRCPRCNSQVLLDFLTGPNCKKTSN
ncbi:Protein salt-induced and EIN3/EIL1-dependent 1 [Hirschfeldia incana]|nr:Protein salt-induced and EIN3/EIL1-dependent 1 [Hirschfeldia incana]KAJ0261325.1 Protein salt-induced and EIN3/EIL1-dependent 1 [Hirschfeldia incana]